MQSSHSLPLQEEFSCKPLGTHFGICDELAESRLEASPARDDRTSQCCALSISEHDVVLVVRDRSGACTDQIVQSLDTAHLAAVLQPVLATDAVLCTDGSGALAAAARHLGVEHHAINASAGRHAIGAWHINNVNGHHSRLKSWLRRFNGVASSYLHHYLGWFRALERFRPAGLQPAVLLALVVGI